MGFLCGRRLANVQSYSSCNYRNISFWAFVGKKDENEAVNSHAMQHDPCYKETENKSKEQTTKNESIPGYKTKAKIPKLRVYMWENRHMLWKEPQISVNLCRLSGEEESAATNWVKDGHGMCLIWHHSIKISGLWNNHVLPQHHGVDRPTEGQRVRRKPMWLKDYVTWTLIVRLKPRYVLG